MALAGILFDKDGTLIDFGLTWGPASVAVMRTLAKGDEAVFSRLAAANGVDPLAGTIDPASPLVAGSSASYGWLWAQALGCADTPALHAEMDRLFALHGLNSLAPIGEPAAVLATLADAGYRLGIATNDAEASAVAQAQQLGLSHRLEFIAGYDSGHGGKPDPGMVLAFARHIGVHPAAVALVGDSTHDLHAARAAGAIGIAVLTGPAPRAELEPLADHVVGSIADLPDLLARLAAKATPSARPSL
jgi:phosphoglycolate phosphatase